MTKIAGPQNNWLFDNEAAGLTYQLFTYNSGGNWRWRLYGYNNGKRIHREELSVWCNVKKLVSGSLISMEINFERRKITYTFDGDQSSAVSMNIEGIYENETIYPAIAYNCNGEANDKDQTVYKFELQLYS